MIEDINITYFELIIFKQQTNEKVMQTKFKRIHFYLYYFVIKGECIKLKDKMTNKSYEFCFMKILFIKNCLRKRKQIKNSKRK